MTPEAHPADHRDGHVEGHREEVRHVVAFLGERDGERSGATSGVKDPSRRSRDDRTESFLNEREPDAATRALVVRLEPVGLSDEAIRHKRENRPARCMLQRCMLYLRECRFPQVPTSSTAILLG